jgi:hypothetical protein
MKNLLEFYKDQQQLVKMMKIINGESQISLRIVDWFVTNFAKKYYTVYHLADYGETAHRNTDRFKVYHDYKLKLKAYSKRRFDPFCRWERVLIPFGEDSNMETTIGQLNFFKWAIEHRILEYIEANYESIEGDMNSRNSTSKRKYPVVAATDGTNAMVDATVAGGDNAKTRKRREELSISACKCIKKETVKIVVEFDK